ncbi:zinc finger MYM-type protein 1-like [Aphis craccivora]|uniref:Zinc finger MYM-type protein 1-like n=1 Tax=Aphis craccivora TaxID=307492 RepID=A0A6G0Y8V2_APHCR|nr:zinc finger MYM-type protein 1-like [Aphis craccivora]
MKRKTSNLEHYKQLSIILRYFDDEKKCPVEQFVGMKRIMSTDSQTFLMLNPFYQCALIVQQQCREVKRSSS